MSENDTSQPAKDRLGQTGSLEPDVPLWTMFVPAATQENYSQIARDQAAIRGTDPGQVLREMADAWDDLHERQPLDGYDHLAEWARQADPSASAGPSGLTVLQARALESARRDPYQAVIGDQAFVEEGVAAQKVQDEQVAAATSAPSVDPASGALPNAGPIPIPADVADPESGAVAQASGGDQPADTSSSTDTSTSSTDSSSTPSSTDTSSTPPSTPAPSTSTSKRGSASSSSSSSSTSSTADGTTTG